MLASDFDSKAIKPSHRMLNWITSWLEGEKEKTRRAGEEMSVEDRIQPFVVYLGLRLLDNFFIQFKLSPRCEHFAILCALEASQLWPLFVWYTFINIDSFLIAWLHDWFPHSGAFLFVWLNLSFSLISLLAWNTNWIHRSGSTFVVPFIRPQSADKSASIRVQEGEQH